LVQQFASMKPADFGRTIEPKWQVAQRLVKEIQAAVEKEHLTPLDGARTISAVAATLFGYDEFILREISPEMLLATAPSRRESAVRAFAVVVLDVDAQDVFEVAAADDQEPVETFGSDGFGRTARRTRSPAALAPACGSRGPSCGTARRRQR